jgi:HSP20 family protein
MTLVRWTPWREMTTVQGRINRFFDESFNRAWPENHMEMANWNPVVDIYDQDDRIVMLAELPGVDKKNISVDLKDNVLTLKGERSYDNTVKEDRYYRQERLFGKFQRAFNLPAGLDPDKVKADYQDGVLKIEIPKPEKEQPKQITVH